MTSIRDVPKSIRDRANSGRSRVYITALTFFALVSLASSFPVLAGDLDKVTLFNIEAQPLGKALLQFGAQAHVQISFAWDSATARLRTHELKGAYSGKDALAELLKGTRLRYVAHKKTVAILPKDPLRTSTSTQSSAGSHVSVADASDGSHEPAFAASDPLPRASKSKRIPLQEVVITGSRLRSTDEEGPQEVQIYDSLYIDQSGQSSVSDFLSTLPSVSLQSQTGAIGVGETVILRGLPVGSTLVLVNGRTLESSGDANWLSGQQYFDLNNIPLAAVQRIEIDENGASAIYGSNAIAGVVNIILKKDFTGVAASAKYDWYKDSEVVRGNLAFGKRWDRGGFSVIGTYGVDGELLNSERLLSASNDYTRFGGPDNNYPVCSPGNIFSTNGAPLPGAPAGSTARYAAVTGTILSGRPNFAQFTYGTLNECSFIAGDSLLPADHNAAILAQGDLEITKNTELFTETLYSAMTQLVGGGYQSLFGLPTFQSYKVSAANPYNPFGETVGVTESLRDVPSTQNINTTFFRPLVGLRGEILSRWQWELSAWQSSDWTRDFLPNYVANRAAIRAALNSPDPATALNPFVSGPIASESMLQTLFTNGNVKMMGRDRSAEAYIRGRVLRLPAGDVEAVIGADYVQSTLEFNAINDGVDPPNTRLQYHQKHSSAFAEARIPILAQHTGVKPHTVLAVTVAGRHDQYSEVGGANTEQFGVEVRPMIDVLLRGTYNEAFEAPPLPSLYTPQTQATALVTDPTTGTPTVVELISGGNPHLKPMTGVSRTVGAVFSSGSLPGVLLSATNWHVSENNAIQSLAPTVIVDAESEFPGRVIRNAAGEIIEVDSSAVNFGSLDVAGIDYRLTFRHRMGPGVISMDLNASETYHYKEALVPGTPAIEAAGAAQDDQDWTPKWKGTAGLTWNDGSLTSYFGGRYTGSYRDYDSTRVIGNFWVFDANLRWAFGSWLGEHRDWLRGDYIEVGAINVFNRAPQFSNYLTDFYGFDAAEMSIVGRSLYVQVGVRW